MNTQGKQSNDPQVMLERLEREGFDNSRVSGAHTVRIGCTACDAIAIQGVACHESGCPNAQKECAGCNELVPMRVKYCEDCR